MKGQNNYYVGLVVADPKTGEDLELHVTAAFHENASEERVMSMIDDASKLKEMICPAIFKVGKRVLFGDKKDVVAYMVSPVEKTHLLVLKKFFKQQYHRVPAYEFSLHCSANRPEREKKLKDLDNGEFLVREIYIRKVEKGAERIHV